MDSGANIFLALFAVFVAAQIGAEVAARLGLPAVVGEILAGVAIGPSAFALVPAGQAEPIRILSEIGAVILLFEVGLDTELRELRRVGKAAISVGTLGVAAPLLAGTLWATASGRDFGTALFIGAAFTATSAGITARVLKELGLSDRLEARVILGAAIVDDLLAMLLLGVAITLASGEAVSLSGVGLIAAQALAFLVGIAALGRPIVRRSDSAMRAPAHPLSPLTISLALGLGLAYVSARVGLAAIIGAFLGGALVAETSHRRSLRKEIAPISAFLSPFFFVSTGMAVSVSALGSPSIFVSIAVVTALAAGSKFVGGWLGGVGLTRSERSVVGLGMIPRGEVGVIVAAIGLRARLFDEATYSILIVMSVLTSILAPLGLKILLRKQARSAAT